MVAIPILLGSALRLLCGAAAAPWGSRSLWPLNAMVPVARVTQRSYLQGESSPRILALSPTKDPFPLPRHTIFRSKSFLPLFLCPYLLHCHHIPYPLSPQHKDHQPCSMLCRSKLFPAPFPSPLPVVLLHIPILSVFAHKNLPPCNLLAVECIHSRHSLATNNKTIEAKIWHGKCTRD